MHAVHGRGMHGSGSIRQAVLAPCSIIMGQLGLTLVFLALGTTGPVSAAATPLGLDPDRVDTSFAELERNLGDDARGEPKINHLRFASRINCLRCVVL